MKKRNILFILLSRLAVLALVAATVLTLASCGSEKEQTETDSSSPKTEAPQVSDTAAQTAAAVTVTVRVTGSDGASVDFTVSTTDGATLRSALESIDLVEGEESALGLYVKVVNGERADFEQDGAYWSFLRNGEYLMTGIDSTYIKDGDEFEIVYTKS